MIVRFVIGTAVGLIGLVGLFLAARTDQSALYEAGLIAALASVFFIFWQIKRSFDDAERHGQAPGGEAID